MASATQTPTEVYLLHVGKKTRLQSAYFPIVFGFYHQTCPRAPIYGNGRIILLVVFFYLVENTSATVRVAELVNKSACRTSILEVLTIVEAPNLGHYGGNVLLCE